MTNTYENRLHEIQQLIHAYTIEDKNRYTQEIQKLEEETKQILHEIGD